MSVKEQLRQIADIEGLRVFQVMLVAADYDQRYEVTVTFRQGYGADLHPITTWGKTPKSALRKAYAKLQQEREHQLVLANNS